MKTSLRLALTLAMLAGGMTLSAVDTGCAKKNKTEAPVETFKVNLSGVTFLRQSTTTIREHNEMRYDLRITNDLPGGPITINRIDFAYSVGSENLGTEAMAPAATIAKGDTQTITVIGHFEWRETSTLPAADAKITGTISWTGPNGNVRSTPFDLSHAYVEGQ